MAERITGRPWSAYEDLLLSKAVADFDGEADWKTIAQRVPGRTNKACRKVRFATIAYLFLPRIPLNPLLAMAPLAVTIDQEISVD
jgi:hypothetical protein